MKSTQAKNSNQHTSHLPFFFAPSPCLCASVVKKIPELFPFTPEAHPAENRKQIGSKSEAKRKQNGSKTEAKRKHFGSASEAFRKREAHFFSKKTNKRASAAKKITTPEFT
jgi:hypothetical protein